MSTLLGTYLLVIGFLLITSVYLDRVGNRLRLPGVLLVLLLGRLLTHNARWCKRRLCSVAAGCDFSRHQHQLAADAQRRVQGCDAAGLHAHGPAVDGGAAETAI